MTMLFVALRAALGSIFLLAAWEKLRDSEGSREAAVALGVPEAAAGPVARSLPLVELAIAGGLLFAPTARPAALVGLVTVAAFTIVLVNSLARGRRPHCNCFGALSQGPIGPRTVVRNVVLLVGFAAVAVFGHQGSVWSWAREIRDLAAAQDLAIALSALALAEGVVIARLLLRPRAVVAAPPLEAGLPIGSRAPAFDLPDLAGQRHTLVDLLQQERKVLLAFVDPGCRPCQALLPEIADWQSNYSELLTIAVVSQGSPESNLEKLQGARVERLLLQAEQEVAAAYRSEVTPSAVVVDPQGRIATTTALGVHEIRHLVEDAVARADAAAPAPEPPGVGEDAPIFALPDRAGEEVSLTGFHGRLRLVVFWSPTCGFCQQLLPSLRAWEETLDGVHDPVLVVVSVGPAAAHDGQEFRHLALDSGPLTRRAYGVTGTPMAILVDASGRIASGLAVGPDETMGLAHRAAAVAAAAERFSSRGEPANPDDTVPAPTIVGYGSAGTDLGRTQ